MERKEVNVYKIQLENIFSALERYVPLGERKAAAVVGGRAKLMNLVTQDKIGVDRTGKNWRFNSADVFRHCRDMRTIRNRRGYGQDEKTFIHDHEI